MNKDDNNNDDSSVVAATLVDDSKERERERERETEDDPNKIPVRHSRVGEQYQAVIERSHSLPSEEPGEIECEWDCSKASPDKVDAYMEKLREVDPRVTKEIFSIEKALALLRLANYDAEKALEMARADPSRITDPDMRWDNGDCNMFEYAYLHIGSDLNEVAKFLKPKTVAQVQRHYYHWKYGKRYKRFLEKNDLLSTSDEEEEEKEEEENKGEKEMNGKRQEKNNIGRKEEEEEEESNQEKELPPPLKVAKTDN